MSEQIDQRTHARQVGQHLVGEASGQCCLDAFQVGPRLRRR